MIIVVIIVVIIVLTAHASALWNLWIVLAHDVSLLCRKRCAMPPCLGPRDARTDPGEVCGDGTAVSGAGSGHDPLVRPMSSRHSLFPPREGGCPVLMRHQSRTNLVRWVHRALFT